jgi:hypothetical protein
MNNMTDDEKKTHQQALKLLKKNRDLDKEEKDEEIEQEDDDE